MKKYFSLAVLLNYILFFAQRTPPSPIGKAEGDGGAGGDGFGTPATPIDMYIFILAIVAVTFVVYFASRKKAEKVM